MIRFFHDKVQLMFFLSVGFHVGFGCKPKPHMQKLQTKATHAKPCCKRRLTEHGQRGFVLLASMLVSSFRGGHHGKGTVGIHVGSHAGFQVAGYGEVTMGKVPPGVHVGCHVGFHVGFQLPGYGGRPPWERYRLSSTLASK